MTDLTVLLSCWNDTYGPHLLKKWEIEEKEFEIPEQVLRFSLIEECHSEVVDFDEIKFKMQLLKNKNCLNLSTTFYSRCFPTDDVEKPKILVRKRKKPQKMLYSLSLIWLIDFQCDEHSNYVKRIFQLSSLLKTQLIHLSGVVKDMLKYDPLQIKNKEHPIHAHLLEFIQKEEIICGNPGVNVTNFSVDQTVFEKSSLSAGKDFLAKAITCHLQMHGRTVVLGHNSEEINKWVNTMSLFVSSHETDLCRYAKPCKDDFEISSSFIPEFWVQGICLPSEISINKETLMSIFSPYNVIRAEYPFCILDIVNKRVRLLYNYSQLIAWKMQFHESKIKEYRLIISSSNPTTMNSKSWLQNIVFSQIAPLTRKRSHLQDSSEIGLVSSDFKFPTSTSISSSIMSLFDQTKVLPHHMKKGWICEYVRGLHRKAVFICKILEQYLEDNPDPSFEEREAVQHLLYRWMEYFDDQFTSEIGRLQKGGKDEVEMDILLAAAQKLASRDIYTFMKGDIYSGSLQLAKLLDSY